MTPKRDADLRRLVTPLALAAWLGGCAGPRPYYETTGLFHDAVGEEHRTVMVAEVEEALGDSRRVLLAGADGTQRQVHPSPEGGAPGLAQLDLASLRAIHMLRDDEYLGAEADLRIRVSGRGREAVTVWVDVNGDVQVRRGRLAKGGKAPSAKALAARHGTGPLRERGTRWSADARRALDTALSLLTGPERSVLRGVPFVRTPAPPGRPGAEGGRYLLSGDTASIELYDRAFSLDPVQFVGPATAGLPAAVRTVLHEVGHAIHQHPARVAQRRHVDAVNRYNALVRRRSPADGARLAALAKEVETTRAQAQEANERGPVLEAYADALGDAEAPTLYGEGSPAESFAESFSLYAADPAALRRVLPAVHAWLSAGGHTSAALAVSDALPGGVAWCSTCSAEATADGGAGR